MKLGFDNSQPTTAIVGINLQVEDLDWLDQPQARVMKKKS